MIGFLVTRPDVTQADIGKYLAALRHAPRPPTDARAAPDDAAVLGFLAASSGARPWPYSAYHPGRTGGPWLCSTFVLSLFHAVVVPSGFRTRVQPCRWIAIWWW